MRAMVASLTRTEQVVGTVISTWLVCTFWTYLLLAEIVRRGFTEDQAWLVLGVLVVATIAAAVVLHRRFRRLARHELIDYVNVGVQRYVVGMFMIHYGIPKLLGRFFDYELQALDSAMAEASEFQLAWYFYGKKPWQELFVGIMEFIPGCLLFYRKTYYAAAVVLVPVVGQVFVLNAFFKIGGITLPLALVILIADLFIVYSEKSRIVDWIRSLDFSPPASLLDDKGVRRWGRVMRGAAMAYAVYTVGSNVWRSHTLSDSPHSQLVGVYSLESARKNGDSFDPTTDRRVYRDLYIERQQRWDRVRRFSGELAAVLLRVDRSHTFELTVKDHAGDGRANLDSSSALRGEWALSGNTLTLKSTQSSDTFELHYVRRNPMPKRWLW